MRSKAIVGGILAAALLSTAAYSQTAPSAPKAAPAQAQTTASMKKHTGDYRASKLIGVNVYNRQNEKIGDINEVLMGKSGKVSGVVVGVGGFLGMGEHDVLVKLEQIKFVNEPLPAAAANTPARTAANPAPTTTATDNRAAGNTAATRSARSANEKWYPDHAVMNATKDQLKAMPAFKYSDYN